MRARTLLDELCSAPVARICFGRIVHLEEPPLQLAFNGTLSVEEKALLEEVA